MKRFFSSVLVLVLLNIGVSFLSAADWPTYQKDYARSGVTEEVLMPPLVEQWIFESPYPPAKGWARPINGYGAMKNKSNVDYDDAFHVTTAGDLALFSSSVENRIYAIKASTGEIVWSFYTDASPRLAPTLDAGRAYVGADDGKVYCLNIKDGNLIWKYDAAPLNDVLLGQGRFASLRPIRTGVAVKEGIAYCTAGLFPSEGVYLFALDARTGDLLWRKPLEGYGNEAPSPQGYPLLNDTSIFLTSRVTPTRWNLSDGSPDPFSTPIPHVKDAAYRYHNGGSYALLWDQRKFVYGQAAILGFDPDVVYKDKYKRTLKGQRLFNWFNGRRILFRGETAWIATDYHMLSVDSSRLAEMSENECKAFEEAYKKHRVATCLSGLEQIKLYGEDSERGQAIKNSVLKYAMKSYEQWPAVRDALFKTFESKCDWMLPIQASESMILAGDVIYAGGEEGLVAVDAKSGKLLWSAMTASRVRGLVVSNGRLFVSTIDGNVRCYQKGSNPAQAQVKPIRAIREMPPSASEVIQLTGEIFAEGLAGKEGYCLILGGNTELAVDIARRSKLNIEVLESNPALLNKKREMLSQAGLYGGRITVSPQRDPDLLPFTPYVFDFVIDAGDTLSVPLSEIKRVTRPYGGQAFVRNPGTDTNNPEFVSSRTASGFHYKRGALSGAANWTHNHGSPANQSSSDDSRVQGPFGILWYGEPGPRERVDRHATAPMPLVVDGVMYIEGHDTFQAYDVYNGRKRWERWIPDSTRMGLPISTSNLVADGKHLYVVAGNQICHRIDSQNGETVQTYEVPELSDHKTHYWGWVARAGDLLYGSRSDADERRNQAKADSNHAVFAIDVKTGEIRWLFEGAGIDHDSIAIDDGIFYLVSRGLNDAEKAEALKSTVRDDSVKDRKAVDRKGQIIEPDLRKIIALDAVTGKEHWSRPFNFTDITLDDAAVGGHRGFSVLSMLRSGVLVISGQGSLGHPYQEYKKGEYARRAIYAFDAKNGSLLWGGRKNYRKRPVIVGEYIYAEPHAWHLKSGKQRMIENPLSGSKAPMDFLRAYSGCGHLIGSGAALFGNAGSGGMAHYNVDQPDGYTPIGNLQLACGTNAVPAGGVFVAPEGRSGCVCATPIYTSLVLYPSRKARSWSYSAGGAEALDCLPVKQVAINLGSPGFRSDSEGKFWLPYPADRFKGRFSQWLPSYKHNADMCYSEKEDLLTVSGKYAPWIYTSGYKHEKELAFTMLDPSRHPAATYTVSLHFSEPEEIGQGERLFDVSIQGQKVLEQFDIVREAGGHRKEVVRQFKGVEVKDVVKIKLDAIGEKLPILNAIQMVRE